MLVLTRKSEEQIIIGDEEDPIIITVLKIQGGKVSLGIKANKKKYAILRKELCVKDESKDGEDSHKEDEEDQKDCEIELKESVTV